MAPRWRLRSPTTSTRRRRPIVRGIVKAQADAAAEPVGAGRQAASDDAGDLEGNAALLIKHGDLHGRTRRDELGGIKKTAAMGDVARATHEHLVAIFEGDRGGELSTYARISPGHGKIEISCNRVNPP
jgi:hypothetical protein